VQVEAVHADQPLAFAERLKAILRKARDRDKQPAAPERFLLQLSMKRVEIADVGLGVPSACLDQIGLAAELKATVDLLADQTEGAPGIEVVCVEQGLQPSLERVASLLRVLGRHR
jgi:hypothetical protein